MAKPDPIIGPVFEIILYVSDMNTQVNFYRDTLGFEVLYPAGLDDYASEFWVTLDTGGCILALHAGGKKDFGTDAPKFVFKSNDIEATRTYLAEKGVAVGLIDSPAPGTRVFDALDPEGNSFFVNSQNNGS